MSDVERAQDLLLGAGKVYFDRFDANGAGTGLRYLGDCSQVEITPAEDEVREHYSSAQSARPLLKRALSRRKMSFAMNLFEFSKGNIGLVLMGEEAEWTQAATPITGEVLSTAPAKDRHYITAKRAIGSVTLKRGATTIPVGEYTIESAESGLIYIKETAPTFDGATGSLTIDYTPTAITAGAGRPWIKAGKSSVIEGKLFFLPDPSTGPKMEVTVWKVSISPDGGFNLVSEEFGEYKIKGDVLSDAANHPNEPYYQVIVHPVA